MNPEGAFCSDDAPTSLPYPPTSVAEKSNFSFFNQHPLPAYVQFKTLDGKLHSKIFVRPGEAGKASLAPGIYEATIEYGQNWLGPKEGFPPCQRFAPARERLTVGKNPLNVIWAKAQLLDIKSGQTLKNHFPGPVPLFEDFLLLSPDDPLSRLRTQMAFQCKRLKAALDAQSAARIAKPAGKRDSAEDLSILQNYALYCAKPLKNEPSAEALPKP